jgi:hypothetical protein
LETRLPADVKAAFNPEMPKPVIPTGPEHYIIADSLILPSPPDFLCCLVLCGPTADTIPEIMQEVMHAVCGAGAGDKLKDMAHNTKDVTKNDRLTTDYGVKQSTADDWLKAASPDKAGPLLLEDPFARERVGKLPISTPTFTSTRTNNTGLDHEIRP